MNAQVTVSLHSGPLSLSSQQPSQRSSLGGGARLVFEGVVRGQEAGRELRALAYQAYEPMTTRELRRLAEEVAIEHGVLGVHVEHSVGTVPVGGVSFRLIILGKHRAEAIAACDAFIARMKQHVPLWKLPVWADADADSDADSDSASTDDGRTDQPVG
ncbi:MAG: molybdenum cofactor biosynthesis protein MoaE [Planctomycetota bacterium]